MHLVRRTILFLSLAAVASLFCSNLHAQGKTNKFEIPEQGGKICPASVDMGGK